MYAIEKTEHLWVVKGPTDTAGDPLCVTNFGTKGEADARRIARYHALNEVEFISGAAMVAAGTKEQQKRLDIAQSALRASTAILERLLEGGGG